MVILEHLDVADVEDVCRAEHFSHAGQMETRSKRRSQAWVAVDFDAVVDFGLFAIDEIKPFKIGKSVAQSNGHFRVEVLS